MADQDLEMVLDINVEAGDWPSQVTDTRALITPILEKTLTFVDLADIKGVEISVLLTDDAHQQVLNAQWRGLDKTTNVLSFPSGESSGETDVALFVGDISLAFETVLKEAQTQGLSFSDHLSHLLVHGLLHLLGFDHEVDEDATEMETLEIEILKTLGLANPYADES
ncbi:MAG: rRNA maturation RNase YbeY [Rhodospirillaceae bacterium]|nr:MAG: rRNA maturation RNase YbeY [Rhodospirillaceae bacterium]